MRRGTRSNSRPMKIGGCPARRRKLQGRPKRDAPKCDERPRGGCQRMAYGGSDKSRIPSGAPTFATSPSAKHLALGLLTFQNIAMPIPCQRHKIVKQPLWPQKSLCNWRPAMPGWVAAGCALGRDPFAEVWLFDAVGPGLARSEAGQAPMIRFGRGARREVVFNLAGHAGFWRARSPRR
jgi:hypothetical protein